MVLGDAALTDFAAIKALLSEVGRTLSTATSAVNAVINQETKHPAKTPAQELAEQRLERAQLAVIQASCQSMSAALVAVDARVDDLLAPDQPASPDPSHVLGSQLLGSL